MGTISHITVSTPSLLASTSGSASISSLSAAQTKSALTENTTTAIVSNTTSNSAFLAQVISQNNNLQEDTRIALSSSFSRFAPAPEYNILVGDSIVKFRPSDAGLPSAYTQLANSEETLQSQLAILPTTTDYQAYNATQSRNVSNLNSDSAQVAIAS